MTDKASSLAILTLNVWNREAPWPARLPLIKSWIHRLQPDLIGFQEVVDADHTQELTYGTRRLRTTLSRVGRMTVTIRNAIDADLGALIRLNAQVQELHAQVCPADFKSWIRATPSER